MVGPALILAMAMSVAVEAEPLNEDTVIFRDPGKYAAFPSVHLGEGDKLWVWFGWNTTRSHYGAAAGGETGSELVFSPDKGRTWIARGEPGFEERPGLIWYHDLGDGVLVSAAGRGHEILDEEKASELKALGVNVVHHRATGKFTACYRARVVRSTDGGATFTTRDMDLPPVRSLMPSHDPGGVRCADGTIVQPQYGGLRDDKAGRVFMLRSTDRGETWDVGTIAYDGVHRFNETSLLRVEDGRIIAHMRNEGGGEAWENGFVFQCESEDCGATWSEPVRLPMWGYPQTLIKLADGAILSTYGYRRHPYGIRACFSYDGGRTWDWHNEVILRSDALPEGPAAANASAGDLGYPRTVELSDGTLFTVYYMTLGDGVTHIACTRWSRDYRGPAAPLRGDDAVRKPDPALPPEMIVGEVAPVALVYGLMQSFVPVAPQISAVAVRVSERSEGYPHAYGLHVAIRRPGETSWWTEILAQSRPLLPDEVTIGGWNLFELETPLAVTPGETYVLTVYNRDYTGGGETKLKEGLEGDHRWFINTGQGGLDDYPNGGMSDVSGTDLAFKVYAEPGPLPVDP